jgi:antirestriction protein
MRGENDSSTLLQWAKGQIYKCNLQRGPYTKEKMENTIAVTLNTSNFFNTTVGCCDLCTLCFFVSVEIFILSYNQLTTLLC